MDLAPIYIWLKLVHVLGALGLVLAHGASAAVTFKLRGERDRVRIGALVDLSNAYLNAFYVAFATVFIAGILTGIAGGFWTSGQLWIWAALVVFVAIVFSMYGLAMPYFQELRHALGIRTFQDIQKGLESPPLASDADLLTLLHSNRPIWVAVVGLVGIVVLVYLMVVKPF
jgi:hypothetical protein